MDNKLIDLLNFYKEHEIIVPNNIKIVDPVGYLEMVWLEVHSDLIVTDSGGMVELVDEDCAIIIKMCKCSISEIILWKLKRNL